jgi:hypothetical protein
MKSVKRNPSHRGAPRKHWRDRITQAAAISNAKALKTELIENHSISAADAEDCAAHEIANKFKTVLKKFSVETIKRLMECKPRTGK